MHCVLQTFYLDTRKLHWPSYIETYVIGAKTFLLKEELSTVPAARAHLRK
jgi:fatty acyl-CoA reductase